MSVRSEITRIQTEVTTQTSLITQIKTSLEDKTGSSISVTNDSSSSPISANTSTLESILTGVNDMPKQNLFFVTKTESFKVGSLNFTT